MSLTIEEVRKVAALARLELSADDLLLMQQQLSVILDYVHQIEQLNTDGVEPLAHPLPINSVFRDDTPIPSLPIDEALQNAPNRAGNFFGVPAVFDSQE